MDFRGFIKFSGYQKTLAITVAVIVLLIGKLFAQERVYTFNKPGSKCYFSYICYAPNNIYNSNKRPYIFILGKPDESIHNTYNLDTIKSMPQFHNFMFVYVPNFGGDSQEKLYCLDALSSLLTFHYQYGRSNLFLNISDSTITEPDYNSSNLNSIFAKVNFCDQVSKQQKNNRDNEISEHFKETFVNYDSENRTDNQIYNVYYIEDEATIDMEQEEWTNKAKKTYFGPPHTFSYTLSGIVRDKLTGEALPFATILVKGTQNGTSTNADGYFTLLNVPNDTSTLIIQYVGYNRMEIFLTPYSAKKNFNIEMASSSQILKGVTITAHKEDIVLASRNDVSMIKMTPKKLENLPSFGEKDIMRSLQLMPGISASNESSSGLYVRGGTPDQNLVLYDGFTVYHVDHLYGFYSAFNTNAIKDIRLYKGGFESRFGGRISSVTEITGKDGNQNTFNLGADLSLLSINAFVELPIGKKFSSVIAYRRSYKGLLYNSIFEHFNGISSDTPAEPQGGPGGRQTQNTTVTSYFYDLNGKFTYRPNNKDIVSLSIFNGMDKLDNSSSMQAPSFGNSNADFGMNSTDLTKYGNIGSSLKWSRKWNETLYGNTIISYSNYFSDRDRSQERNTTNPDNDEVTTTKTGVFENNDLRDYSFKSDFELNLVKNTQIQFGVFESYYDIDYSYADNDTAAILKKYNSAILAGGYLQSKLSGINEMLNILPGIRISYFEPTDKLYFEPRISLSFKLNSQITIKGATGKYYQFVNRVTREDILSGSKDFWLLSDGSSVPVSSAIHYEIGMAYESINYLFSAEAYYKKIDQLTEYSLRFNISPLGVSYNENFFSGNGFAKGIEFLVQKYSGKINGWVSYTLGSAQNQFDVYSDSYYPANQDVTHEFKIVSMYKYKRWDFSATWIFATGRPYTAPSGAYTVSLLDGTEQDYFTVTSKNGLRLPDYHRCDLSVNYKILLGSKKDRKRRDIGYIGLSIFNVYNRQNVWYKEFTIQDGAILETNVNYLGLTPNLILSLKLR